METGLDDPTLSDAALVDLVNQGDEAAFEALYRRHRDWVVNLAYRWTGDRETALDVLQETFLYLSRKFPEFKLTARMQTFLYPAVRNLSIAARRKRERFEPVENAEEAIERTATAEEPASDDSLQAAVASLTEEHRSVLLARFVDGLNLAEIAEALGIPLGTVKSRLHNALELLRKDPRTRSFFE